ncbi:hypothetical protein Pan216_41920 [Planctomycetes bacterium Pan216]|uniref:Carboxypeptidase regulatory-like domain-containing protein n=1 Tax=Kolteria novifilia TaxID=2527975 RepID=A0A518B8K3_9BACT|nr:hypothetical protein Pan216_41920 [Planctomycetes bacterium Pan216]
MPRHSSVPPRLVILAAALLAVPACGPAGPTTWPVTGKVVFPDGEPVAGGIIEFSPRDKGQNARGKIATDGTFTLTTGDRAGAREGPHGIIVMQHMIDDRLAKHRPTHAHQTIDPRFRQYGTSGLERTVAPSENHFVIEVAPAPPKPLEWKPL